jgi:hypothetical protein
VTVYQPTAGHGCSLLAPALPPLKSEATAGHAAISQVEAGRH